MFSLLLAMVSPIVLVNNCLVSVTDLDVNATFQRQSCKPAQVRQLPIIRSKLCAVPTRYLIKDAASVDVTSGYVAANCQ